MGDSVWESTQGGGVMKTSAGEIRCYKMLYGMLAFCVPHYFPQPRGCEWLLKDIRGEYYDKV